MSKNKKSNQLGRKKERIFSNLCLLPSFAGVMIFFFIPFCIVIYYAFINNTFEKEFNGLGNFKFLFNNQSFKTALTNTATFTIIAVPLSIILSLFLAMILEAKIPGKSIFRTFFLCPLMVPSASVVLIWQVVFHNHGSLNAFIEKFGLDSVDWLNSPYCQVVIILMFLWKNLGYNMILFMSGLSSIPKDIMEVADLEGASGFYKFFHIKLRYLSPTIIFVLILSLINSFKIFREIYLLTGSYPYKKMYMLQHFMNNTFDSFDYQKLSSAAIILAGIMIIIIGILLIVENHFGKDVEEQ